LIAVKGLKLNNFHHNSGFTRVIKIKDVFFNNDINFTDGEKTSQVVHMIMFSSVSGKSYRSQAALIVK